VLKDLQGHSIQYRIAVGPHKGRKAFMLQSLPPLTGSRRGVARESGRRRVAAVIDHGYGRLVSFERRFPPQPRTLPAHSAGYLDSIGRSVYRQGVQSPERNSSSTELTFSGCSAGSSGRSSSARPTASLGCVCAELADGG